jgi:hypothetical protein
MQCSEIPPRFARCGREFDSKRLRELTVHHKDHDHGRNWERLCLYRHDAEHSRYLDQEWQGADAPGSARTEPGTLLVVPP